jgi:5'-3' exonuclease
MTWWRNAYPETSLDSPIDNPEFVNKFRTTFISSVQQIAKKLKIVNRTNKVAPTIYVGKDCPRLNIWRQTIYPEYKATRDKDDGFLGGPFFKMAYEEDLFIQGGAIKVLKHPKLEADDCIAISVKQLLEKEPTCKIYIIASDKDYLQLASEQVQIYTLAFKNISDSKSSHGNKEMDLFCKIVMGDVSDNIKAIIPKCGPKTALKLFEDKTLFESKLADPTVKANYERNRQLVDFNYIPEEYVNEFLQGQNTNTNTKPKYILVEVKVQSKKIKSIIRISFLVHKNAKVDIIFKPFTFYTTI